MNPIPFAALPLLLCFQLMSVPAAMGQPPADDGTQVRLETGAVHQWGRDLDASGEVSVNAWSALLGASRPVGSGKMRLGFSVGYGERDYDFGGGQGFAAGRPWSTARDARISAQFSWKPEEQWQVFVVPTLRWSAEKGASLDDGRYGGLLAAASWKVNDRLSIGPGFGVFSEIEDDTDWFPILAIDWRLTDTLTLRTGRGFAASRAPGLRLDWAPPGQWEMSLGARYEKFRFRLDDEGVARHGVGQETSVPIYLGATRHLGEDARLSLVAGVELNGELRIEDRSGNLLQQTAYDTAPFAGAVLELAF